VANIDFRNQVAEFAGLVDNCGMPVIGFGLKEFDTEIVASLNRSAKWAKILVVGPPGLAAIEGFDTIIDGYPEQRLATLLATDEVEGIVRGTIDDFKTLEAYERLSGERHTFIPALLELPKGQQLFLSPASNPEGWVKEDRLHIAEGISAFVADWGINPTIAVYTGVRHDTYERRKHECGGIIGTLNKTYQDAEWIVAELTKKGYFAKNWSIDLNVAIKEGYVVHIPVNGMVGNQAFRGLLAGGGKVLAAPRLGLSRPYEDNSRTEKDFDFHIKWLVAQINRRKGSQPR